MKKLFTRYLIVSFIFLTSFHARADIDTQNMAGTTLAGAGSMAAYLGVATGTAIAVSGGLALGALGVALLIKNASQPAPSDNLTAPISIRLNPKVPLIVPSGWTAPSGSNIQPVPPSSTQYNNPNGGTTTNPYYIGQQFTVGLILGTSPTTTCANTIGQTVGTAGSLNQPVTAASLAGNTCTVTFINNAGNTQNSGYNVGANTCPTGYASTGTDPNKTCTVSSPSQVIKPKKGVLEIVRTGNTLAIDPQANPSDKISSPTLTVTSTSATVVGSDGSITNVTINADGTATITSTTPTGTAGVSNQKKVIVSAPDATTGDVTVTGTQDQQVNGQGTGVSTTPIASSGGGSGPTIDISSLNKEATQVQIKNNTDTIKTDVTSIKDAITNAENNPTDLADKKTEFDTIAQAHSDKIKSIGDGGLDAHGFSWTWSPVVPTGTCTPFSHSFGGHAFGIKHLSNRWC